MSATTRTLTARQSDLPAAVTSAFASHGSKSFDSPRHLLEFARTLSEPESILGEFRESLESLSHLAPIRSTEGAQTISTLVRLNRQVSGRRELEPGDAPQDNLLDAPEFEGSVPVEDWNSISPASSG